MSLNLIYHFQSSQNQNEHFMPPNYRVIYFFSENGMLDRAFLQEMSKSVPDADHMNLSFSNLEDLKVFALRVCLDLAKKEVRLISAQDYNIGIDGATDQKSYKNIFDKYGELAINTSFKKKGLLSKLFS